MTGLTAPRLALKWPNDLLVDGAKCSGLLLEGESGAGRFAVIAGLGVNIASCAQGTPYPASFLRAHAPDVTIEAVLAALVEAWLNRFDVWRQPAVLPQRGRPGWSGRPSSAERSRSGCPRDRWKAASPASTRRDGWSSRPSEDGVSSMQEIYSLGMDKPRRADFRSSSLSMRPQLPSVKCCVALMTRHSAATRKLPNGSLCAPSTSGFSQPALSDNLDRLVDNASLLTCAEPYRCSTRCSALARQRKSDRARLTKLAAVVEP